MATKLASQGLNVVLVSLPDELLDATHAELTERFPEVTLRKVGVDLGTPGYMPAVQKALEDIDVQIAFLNAGYVLTGFFADVCVVLCWAAAGGMNIYICIWETYCSSVFG